MLCCTNLKMATFFTFPKPSKKAKIGEKIKEQEVEKEIIIHGVIQSTLFSFPPNLLKKNRPVIIKIVKSITAQKENHLTQKRKRDDNLDKASGEPFKQIGPSHFNNATS